MCTGTETCNLQNNQCVPGTPINCSDGNVCTTDGCDPAVGCQHVNNTSACNDGSACTANDSCANGDCEGDPITCDDGDGCTVDTCDPGTGCVFTPIAGCQCDEGSDCSDDNVCTGTETCVGMRCVSGIPLDCNDGTICTTDACDAVAGCQHVNNTSACDDNNACTADDICSGGSCSGTPTGCDDGNGCTSDTCDPGTGCVFTPIAGCQCDEDSDCSDDNVCTGTEICNLQNNQCVPGTPINCSDGTVCTTDSCDPAAGCQYVNNTAPCNDGSACTAGDSCSGGDCEGTPVSCDDGDGCTSDTCNPETGCVYTPIPGCECDEESECDDGLFCNGSESCMGGLCQPGANPCDDGFFCNGEDGCDEGTDTCSGHSGNPCTSPLTCDEASDACVTCMNDEDCDDGNPCSVDVCNEGSCAYSCCVDQCEDYCCDDPLCADSAFCGADVLIEAHYAVAEPAFPAFASAGDGGSFQSNYPFPGGVGVKLQLCLDNPTQLVGGLQLDVCEYDPDENPLDCMKCINCELSERTTMFDCAVLELPGGCCRVLLFCKNPGCAINPGFCTIVTVVYEMYELSEECNATECITAMPENMIVSNYDGYEIPAAGLAGEICPFVCGDVCPPGQSLGNGVGLWRWCG